jgi:hypothetical protein
MPLRGPQLAYYLKKRNPELYRKVKEVKDRYNVTWDEAFAILKGEKKPPTQVVATGSEIQISDVVKRVESLEKRVGEFGKVFELIDIGLKTRLRYNKYDCVYMDSKGYCKMFYWTSPLEGLEMIEVVEGGEKRYYLNVKKSSWFCLPCPRYRPKYWAEFLKDLVTWVESLEARVAHLEQATTQRSISSELEKVRESLEKLRKELKF